MITKRDTLYFLLITDVWVIVNGHHLKKTKKQEVPVKILLIYVYPSQDYQTYIDNIVLMEIFLIELL